MPLAILIRGGGAVHGRATAPLPTAFRPSRSGGFPAAVAQPLLHHGPVNI